MTPLLIELFRIGFLNIRFIDVIDILIVAFLMYKLYQLLKGGVAINIFIGLLSIYLLYWLFVRVFHMQLLGELLGQFIGVGVIALIIVFQQEVRRFLIVLGTNSFIARNNLTRQILPWNWQAQKNRVENFDPIVKACRSMAKSKTGAIIILARSSELKFYSNTGDVIDAVISRRLIETIFSKNSPLHDGAIIIVHNRIRAARCVLPVTENSDLPARLGMRHRAAIGITEHSDAIAIIVSEETGEISYAREGQIELDLTPEELQKVIEMELS